MQRPDEIRHDAGVEPGRLHEAATVIADLLKARPISNMRNSRNSVFRTEHMSDLYIGGLEKAGLPE